MSPLDTRRPSAPRGPGAGALKVLVADDDEDSREMLGYLLSSEGHEVAQAIDGPSTVAQAEAFRPDVAIVDLTMPCMSGYEVAETLRRTTDTRSIVLIALSGQTRHEDRTRAADSGFDRHFTKPVDFTTLLSYLAGIHPTRQ